MHTRIIGGTVMLGFGGVLGFIAVLAFVRRLRRQAGGCAATGTIVGHRERRHSEGTTYSPEVEFQTPLGERIRFVAPFGSGRRPTVGRRVRVLYYPGDPEDAAILSFADIWVVPVLLMLAAAGFIAMSFIFYTGILDNP
jgi:hypothetical protein